LIRIQAVLVLSAVLLSGCAIFQKPEGETGSYGHYIGMVEAQWLEDGRTMKLLKPLVFVDPDKLEWTAPAGSVVDGASIPQAAWSLIGGPFEGKYRNASVIHDVACVEKTRSWQAVHNVFYYAMLASGVDQLKAKTMYAAVYQFGPRWDVESTVVVAAAPGAPTEAAVKTAENAEAASKVEVLERKPVAGQPGKARVRALIRPPAKHLEEKDFEKLKAAIAAREKTKGAVPMTLEEIRNYHPQ
jgi:hypothetical protein